MVSHVINVSALTKRFGTHTAVDGLSIAVAPGEVFGFIGPNGAGKTTALKMLLGLIEPSGGSGTVLNAPLGSKEARRKIGFLPEQFRFHDCLTAREFLRFHGRFYGMARSKLAGTIDELLSRVNLLEAADRRLGTYSKGMLQRAGLAQALLNAPALVFLDEPTSALDPLGRLLVRDIIGDLRARGTAVFLNSHLLGEVEKTCDRVAFMKNGRLIEELTLKSQPAALDVELRLGAATPIALAAIAQFGRVVSVTGNVIRLAVDSESELPRIVQSLTREGVEIFGLQSRTRSLEDKFIQIMGEDARPG